MTHKQDASLAPRILTYIHRLEDGLLSLLLLSMIGLAAAQIFMRNLFDYGFVWADPLLRIMVLWALLLLPTTQHCLFCWNGNQIAWLFPTFPPGCLKLSFPLPLLLCLYAT